MNMKMIPLKMIDIGNVTKGKFNKLNITAAQSRLDLHLAFVTIDSITNLEDARLSK